MFLSSKKKAQRPKAGFTFIELLIAVTIFPIVSVALYSAFFAGISVWKRSIEGGDVYQSIRYTYDDITRDLRNSVYMKKPSDGEAEEGGSIFDLAVSSSSMTFFTLGYVVSEKGREEKSLTRVRYWYDEDSNVVLGKRASSELGFDLDKAAEEILIANVSKFKFLYAYSSKADEGDYDWKDEWTDKEKRVPQGVKCEFSVQSESDREEKQFSKTIFIPLGVLGEEEFSL